MNEKKLIEETEEKRVYEIQGHHGMIYLTVPNRKPTKEEWDELYNTVAIATIMDEKYKARQKEKLLENLAERNDDRSETGGRR